MKTKKESVQRDLIQCPYEDCKHKFFTKSKLKQITCNGCGRKIKREECTLRIAEQEELS